MNPRCCLLTGMLLCGVVARGAAVESESATERWGAYPERDVILLTSQKQHKGPCQWRMMQVDKATGGGQQISQTAYDAKQWAEAVVPGTVLNSLVANKVYPEPYFGLNNAHEKKRIPDISAVGPKFYTYWFRTEFSVPVSFRQRQVWLQLDGINYRAEVWVNGRKLGDMAGMFRRGLFNATDAVAIGRPNVLAVRVQPPDRPGAFKAKKRPKPLTAGENRNGGDGLIGTNVTQLMTVGWDFTFPDGIRDRNTGIWRDVKLYATGPVALRAPFVASELPLPETDRAKEKISVEAVNATAAPQEGVVRATIRQLDLTLEKKVRLAAHETQKVFFTADEYPQLLVANPRLWWPLNKGEQYLYGMAVEFVQDGNSSDRIKSRFAIRDIRSDQNTPDKSRRFSINGRPLFMHGTNWVPEAMCRTYERRTWAELRYTRQAGVNFIRLWAGGVTESDQFFDLCDELGILVWVEFWQAGDTQIPTAPEDVKLYRENVVDTVKRVRNHASLGLYVSANERPDFRVAVMRPDMIVPIKDLLDDLDPTHNWLQSSEKDGIHDGSPYWAVNPMWYYEDTGSDRGSRVNGFCPEYGCPILPTVDCLREMMDAKDLWPVNKTVWDYLDGGGFHQMTGEYAKAVEQYGPSKGIEEYALKAQVFGGLAYRALWEVWNYNRFDYGDRYCTGMLFWYHNSPNRQVCGRLYDWSLEPTAALYFSQTAHQPLHAQYDFLKNTVSVNNELVRAFRGCRLTARIFNLDMSEVYRRAVTLDIPADRLVKDAIRVELPKKLSPVHFIRLDLADDKGQPVSSNFYWRSDKAYKPGRTRTGPQYEGFEDLQKLPRVALQTKVQQSSKEGRNYYTVAITNPSKSLAFFVWLRLQQASSGKPIRPAFYDDNFLSLLPGESRSVQIEYSGQIPAAETKLVVDGWNIVRQEHPGQAH